MEVEVAEEQAEVAEAAAEVAGAEEVGEAEAATAVEPVPTRCGLRRLAWLGFGLGVV